MDFIEYSNDGQLLGVIIGLTFFAAAIFSVVLSFRNVQRADRLQTEHENQGSDYRADPLIKRFTRRAYLQLPLAFFLFLAGVASVVSPAVSATDERRAAVLDRVESTYGLELTADELRGLEYPTDRPESDFAAFGSIEKLTDNPDGLIKEEIYLIWKDGEMRLARSEDGERFSELETS